MDRVRWFDGVVASFDTETTGVDPKTARIVSVAFLLIDADGRTLPGSFCELINPGEPIPAEATETHGITDEMVRADGINPVDAIEEIARMVQACITLRIPIVIYNVPYDWPLLRAEVRRHRPDLEEILDDARLIDPLLIDRHFHRYRKGSRKLEAVAAFYGVALDDAHESSADAFAAERVLRALAARYLQDLSVYELQLLQPAWFDEWRDDFNEYRVKNGQEPITDPWPSSMDYVTQQGEQNDGETSESVDTEGPDHGVRESGASGDRSGPGEVGDLVGEPEPR